MDLSNKKILIVDDEEDLRELLVDFLEADGALISQADNGNVAFELIKDNEYDLVISDVRMPECSGIELLEKIKSFEHKAPPIIMMSAFSEYSEAQFKRLGAKAMFIKPGTLNQLKELILETLG